MLLHNSNKYASIPIAHSVTLDENYCNMKMILEKTNDDKHRWEICTDLKVVTILLGQQSGFTKFPCYLCEWDSRNRKEHYVKKIWQVRKLFVKGQKNIIEKQLVEPSKIIIPPLHVKLGLIKQFVKALQKRNSEAFQFLFKIFPKLSEAKIKAGVFDGPQIRQLLNNKDFQEHLDQLEKKAWTSYREVVKHFLGGDKHPNYEKIVKKMVDDFKNIDCLMSLKLYLMDSHVNDFADNPNQKGEEQGERAHQDMQEVESRYQGFWDKAMLADYCWMLDRDTVNIHKKRALKRSFVETCKPKKKLRTH